MTADFQKMYKMMCISYALHTKKQLDVHCVCIWGNNATMQNNANNASWGCIIFALWKIMQCICICIALCPFWGAEGLHCIGEIMQCKWVALHCAFALALFRVLIIFNDCNLYASLAHSVQTNSCFELAAAGFQMEIEQW